MSWNYSEWRDRLSSRLLIAYLGAWLMTLLCCAAGVAGVLHFFGDRLIHHSAVETAHVLGSSLVFDREGKPIGVNLEHPMAWVFSALPNDLAYRVFDDRGTILLASSSDVARAWMLAGVKAEPVETDGRAEINGLVMEMRTVRIPHSRDRIWLQVATSDRLVDVVHSGSSSRLGVVAFFTALVSIALLGLVLCHVLQRLLSPIQALALDAREIELSQLDRRLGLEGVPSELLPLVESFNHALGRLESGYAAQRRFLADTAHELKTPLSLLRGQLEVNGTSDTDQLLRDVDLISRQVQQLLMLAEVSETRNYVRESVNVAEVVNDVVSYLRPLAQRRSVDIQVDAAAGQNVIQCDRSALFVLLKNLAENAISFAPPGTLVLLSIDEHSVRVRDRGAGVAPEHFPHLFERFWRAPERQESGAGLGLALCQAVAQAHGWQLSAHNVDPGAEFRLAFTPLTVIEEHTAS